ncbi:MAG TPA: PEGA domain-containing protein [Terriglobales bacterium]
MSEKIGRFEIASQLAQSPFATVYKATDTESQQTVALKVVRLDSVADRDGCLKAVFDEAERAKPLSSHNIAGLFGVGDEGDLLLAAAEYVQGNSVATTLARHEGFSIWDLQDIARQACQGLDHAHGHNVIHVSLEPAKIMVQWDGLVKILGFGISTMNASRAASSETVPEVLYYASPEQARGEACDHRSAIFSLGAILYEMATEQKAFAGNTPDEIRTAILESTPPLPHRLKGNVNPALSALIMKALSKSPDERFQSGQELVKELEQCKSQGGLAAKAAVAAASRAPQAPRPEAPKPAGSAFAGAPAAIPKSPVAPAAPTTTASVAAPAEEKPGFAVDPMMAGDAAAASPKTSFSDISELPPLKEVRIVDPPPMTAEEPVLEEVPEPVPAVTVHQAEPEKPKVQVRAAAKKAVTEIRKTPPKLYLYAVGGAILLIAVFLLGMTLHNYWEDRETSDSSAEVQETASQPQTAPKPAQAAPPAPVAQQPAAQAPAQPDTQADQATEQPEAQPEQQPQPRESGRGRRGRNRARTVAIVPAQLTVNSTPAGASISFDGAVLCQSPCTLTGIAPGQHSVSAAKEGYSSAAHSIVLASGANSSVTLELNAMGAGLNVASTPAGAVIVLDGRDTGKLTPAHIAVQKPGSHTVTLRRSGYLDASSSVSIQLGQSSNVNLQLTQLGDTDDIRPAGGRFKKMFGGGGGTSEMGVVSVKTQPKGAQIMVNNRVLDKNSPFDFYLNPGTYILDITMSGYKPIHKVITVQEGEKVAIQETLNPE